MTLPFPDQQDKPRKCICCGIGERYRPGTPDRPWIDRGAFQRAREVGAKSLPPVTVGPICPDCVARQPKAP